MQSYEEARYCPSYSEIQTALATTYQAISVEGGAQKTFLAGARTIIGIVSVSYFPVTALAGGLCGITMPSLTQTYCNMADIGLNNVWNTLSFKAKAVSTIAGTVLVVAGFNTSVLAIPCAIFASKIGAELGVRNSLRQT
ncbi:MAG: hypothetical protein H0T62_13615 [Parachlamydiaceae bacterium]|nr:hypothetical protein [Parachlamydiaceae bacterium]